MTDLEPRDIIEKDVKEKMLGPGYAKDIFSCGPDANDEVLPDNPRNIYSVGVLPPSIRPANGDDAQVDAQDDAYPDDTDDTIEEDNPNEIAENEAEDDDYARKLSEAISSHDNDDDDDTGGTTISNMDSHIGLIACVNSGSHEVDIEVEYGTYHVLQTLSELQTVRVNTGIFTQSISNAIQAIDNDANARVALRGTLGWDSLGENIEVNVEEGYIQIAENCQAWAAQRPKFGEEISRNYSTELRYIKLLLSRLYRRDHHQSPVIHVNLLDINPETGVIDQDDPNIELYGSCFTANGRKFVKVLLRNVSNGYIYQPKLTVRGDLQSYVEPVNLTEDAENAVNEFLYRNVLNYGKGVNCAIDWNRNDAQVGEVFTTFAPTVDVEKFWLICQKER